MIHQHIIMLPKTYFGYFAGGVYTLVVRGSQDTRICQSEGAPIKLIERLESYGYKLCKPDDSSDSAPWVVCAQDAADEAYRGAARF